MTRNKVQSRSFPPYPLARELTGHPLFFEDTRIVPEVVFYPAKQGSGR
ncbi:MAG: hypothetical protein HYV97_07420 [Bdellovibrio sp.]|nr:hypothetical protein [Bdellovibrio sp.]